MKYQTYPLPVNTSFFVAHLNCVICLTKFSLINIIKLYLHHVDYVFLKIPIAFEKLSSLFYADSLAMLSLGNVANICIWYDYFFYHTL